MLPRFKSLSAVALYTSDLPASENLYRLLGLQRELPAGSVETKGRLLMSFSGGDTCLVLHDDAQRQFVEVTVSVDDVRDIYFRLARDPSYTWIETPYSVGDEWRAVVRLPDDNVFTLLSTEAAGGSRPVDEVQDASPKVTS